MAGGMTFGRPFRLQVGADALLQSPRKFKPGASAQQTTVVSKMSVEVDFAEVVQQVLPSEETLRVEYPNAVDVTSTAVRTEVRGTTKKKKVWTGPIKRKRNLPLPPWSDTYLKEKQADILSDLVSSGLPVALVLESWLGKLTRVDLSDVLRELEGMNKVTMVLEVFQWMKQRSGRLNPKAHVCVLVLGILGRACMVSDAEEVFKMILEHEDWDKVRAYNTMIGAYYKVGMPREAWDLYQKMHDSGVEPDEATFNTLLAGKAGLHRLFADMKACGLKPNLRSYNAVIRIYSREGSIEKVESLVGEMIKDGVQPDLFSYNGFISACSRGKKATKALEVLEEMKAAGIKPDTVTYTALIQVLGSSSRHQDAIGIFESMQTNGCQPDLFTYSLLVSVYGKAGMVEDAVLVFMRLQLEGFKPSLVTWSSLISGYLQRKLFEDAVRQLRRMEDYGVQADVYLYNSIMNSYAAAGSYAETINVFEKFKAQGVTPNCSSYVTVVNAMVSSGRTKDAKVVYASMLQEGLKLRRKT